MLQTLKKFFAFCGADNRKLFVISIWLGVVSAICSAMRIPAAAIVIQALLQKNVTMATLWHHRCISDCDHRHQHEGHHAPDPCGISCLRQQADRDRRASAVSAYGLVQ